MFTVSQRSLQESFRWLRRTLTIIVILSIFMTTLPVQAISIETDPQPSFPIRAVFYYPWFPEAWEQQGFNLFTNYTPSLGFYDGGDQDVIRQQIDAMQYGGIQAGIASWWGQGSSTDNRLPALLQAALDTEFRWSVYYEPEGQGDPSLDQITGDLTYLRDNYGNDPSFLRIDGRFVVFVYADAADTCGMVDRWMQANTVGAYLVLKVFDGYLSCASQPDGWHQYGPAVPADSQEGFSYTISPGFWKKGDPELLPRDLMRWNQNIQDMIASDTPFQLITTFNEWGEGTAIESAQEWETSSGYGAYLDALHNNGLDGQPIPTAEPLPTEELTQPDLAAVATSIDPVIAAAGDIACDPGDPSFNGGNGTASECRQKAVSDLLVGRNYAAVLALGDLQYENGALSKFNQSYDLSWARVKNITRPAVGNHEYGTSGAGGYFSYFGAAAGDRTKGYYSFDIGAWHIIALNSNCSYVGGCGAGSSQEQWLRADLAAHPNTCTLAYWHHPRFSSGDHGNDATYDAFWRALYAAGADLVLNGHDHSYERLAPLNPSGAADPRGIQSFIVGTGGKKHYGFPTVLANSIVRNATTYGILQLTLHPTSYDWQFIPEPGRTFTDSGLKTCVGASSPQPTPTPSGSARTFDDRNTAFAFSSGWRSISTTRAYGGSYRETTQNGATVTFPFTGQSFSLVYKGGITFSKFDVYVDGALVATLNQKLPAATYQVRWDYPGQLAAGNHTLKLVFRVTSSTIFRGSLDAVIVR